jgi:hypothetical protein
MKRQWEWVAFSLVAALALSGCWYYETYPTGYGAGYSSYGSVIVEAPPAAVYEDPLWSSRPDPYHSWVPGHWRWTSHGYRWVPGRWVSSPYAGAVWVPGHYRRVHGGWAWVDGHWR